MKLHNLISGSALGALLVVAAGVATADNHAEDLIKQAMSAGPDSISAQATIMDSDGTILREGSNGWTCLPHTMPGDNAPMCNDALWMKMMQAVGSKGDFEADGIGMSALCGGTPGSQQVEVVIGRDHELWLLAVAGHDGHSLWTRRLRALAVSE